MTEPVDVLPSLRAIQSRQLSAIRAGLPGMVVEPVQAQPGNACASELQLRLVAAELLRKYADELERVEFEQAKAAVQRHVSEFLTGSGWANAAKTRLVNSLGTEDQYISIDESVRDKGRDLRDAAALIELADLRAS